jgi:hypothetical protein
LRPETGFDLHYVAGHAVQIEFHLGLPLSEIGENMEDLNPRAEHPALWLGRS